ncbi:MAG: transporter substrate-binding domain-containing protein [Alphaproteobacteria bacterium]|nr:transporter substrate-binding domain-containing protein [Alphaproteobacteria bacterium]
MTGSPSSDMQDPEPKAPAVLRLALFPSFFYRKDRETGELRGVGVELARALALRLGASLTVAEFLSPPKVVEALATGAADVAMLGIDPMRGAEVDYSPPVLAADFTFLVAAGSELRDIASADRPGMRIALVRHHAMDTALRGKLAHAERVYADTPDAAFELFRSGSAGVLAGIRPGLLMYARMMPGTRVLGDRYGRNVIALAVRKGEADLLSHVRAFAEQARADGTVARAIAQAGLGGVDVA